MPSLSEGFCLIMDSEKTFVRRKSVSSQPKPLSWASFLPTFHYPVFTQVLRRRAYAYHPERSRTRGEPAPGQNLWYLLKIYMSATQLYGFLCKWCSVESKVVDTIKLNPFHQLTPSEYLKPGAGMRGYGRLRPIGLYLANQASPAYGS